MEALKNIIDKVKTRLQTVEELKYIDSDWGQLDQEPPAVKWPCALVDIDNADYEDLGRGGQMVDVHVKVTVALQRLTPGSTASRRRAESYKDYELLGEVHNALHLYGEAEFTPLLRSRFYKEPSEPGTVIYNLTYHTSYETPPAPKPENKPVRTFKIAASPDVQ